MKITFLVTVGLLAFVTPLLPQSSEVDSKQKPDEVVQEWFSRWNDLDGSEQALNRFVELYEPDAIQQMGPSERQIGPVLLNGREAIKVMASEFTKRYTHLNYESLVRTVKEKTEQAFYIIDGIRGQAGVIGVATEFVGRYAAREGSKRYVLHGAAFFEIRDGKIKKLRLYTPREETEEIMPLKTEAPM